MGFGTLFIGYFFLLNISYYAYTDIIAAMLCLMATYKLSWVNRGFKASFILSIIFAVFSLGEILVPAIELLGFKALSDTVTPYVAVPRLLAIFALTAAFMVGIRDVAREAEAFELSKSASTRIVISPIFLLMALFEIPQFGSLFGVAANYIAVALILVFLVVVAMNLVTVYKAYMQIYIPGQQKARQKRKGGFMSKFEEYEEKKSREYAEYKIKRDMEKIEKKKGKKK